MLVVHMTLHIGANIMEWFPHNGFVCVNLTAHLFSIALCDF